MTYITADMTKEESVDKKLKPYFSQTLSNWQLLFEFGCSQGATLSSDNFLLLEQIVYI